MIKIAGGWSRLKYWNCGEFDVVLERLNDLRKAGTPFCPQKDHIFRSLQMCPFDQVRVVLMGQDPYPDPVYPTGIAFDVDPRIPYKSLPPTLKTIFEEYNSDLGYPIPNSGSLVNWCYEGVLLWNAIPTCDAWKSKSHDWPEWKLLTQELVEELSKKGKTVFVFLGNTARQFAQYVEPGEEVIEVSHPSPRASRASRHPFLGSRIFSTVNDKLCAQGLPPIDWRL